ncbi:MAG: hypothetical protein JWO85_1230, partial [Candidatus Eremiobacteraeota bacterium]|nr:hypothetical protein [Candidatus Eremiobacteraeota bacterium]
MSADNSKGEVMKNNLFAAAALVVLAALIPASALAQSVPSYASGASDSGGDENIHGRIVNFDGAYNLQVQDNRGYTDNVELHQGTIINPTGITLQPGMVVSILGYNSGSYLAANEIDTPYTFYSGVPYWQGHPWNYYGPSYGLNLYFGNVGWWHGSELRTGFTYRGGVRVYSNSPHIFMNHGGSYQGHAFVAPPNRGGYHPTGGAPHGYPGAGNAFGGRGPQGGAHFGGGSPQGGAHFGGGGPQGGGG